MFTVRSKRVVAVYVQCHCLFFCFFCLSLTFYSLYLGEAGKEPSSRLSASALL